MPKQPWSEQNYIGITLYAGAPNPRWEMPNSVLLKARLQHLPSVTLEPNYLPANSWYGGVVVHFASTSSEPRRRFLIYQQRVFDSASEIVRADVSRALEEELFLTMPLDLNNRLDKLQFVTASQHLNEDKKIIGTVAGEAKPDCAGAPTFAVAPPPVKWDQFPGIEDNNCYNYANNEFSTIDDAQPGHVPWQPHTEEEMHALLVADGLVPVGVNRKTLPAACSTDAGAHLIAVCLRTPSDTKIEDGVAVPVYKDYHCFRLDSFVGGPRWTHKDGANPSTDDDNGGADLSDLAGGHFKVTHNLVGYYWSVPGVRDIGLPVFP